jgi:hypothetical protein
VLASGYAEFNDIDIRGATYTGSIFAGSGTIGGIVINAHNLRTRAALSRARRASRSTTTARPSSRT